jgi:hypothetical protein
MNPQDLKSIVSQGLLSFPVTDFDQQGNFNAKGYAERLEWLAPYGASALFAAGGTGEFFSLDGKEYPEIIKTAVQTCKGSNLLPASTTLKPSPNKPKATALPIPLPAPVTNAIREFDIFIAPIY